MLPEDVYENVLYYDVTTTEGSYETVCDGIIAAYEAWNKHAGINGAEVRVYALEGGQPLYSKSYTYTRSGAPGPHEVAVCLSYAAVSNWETTTARRRGRIFLGPMTAPFTAMQRPDAQMITDTLAFGQALAAVGAGGVAGWVMYSPTDGIAVPILSISVDNAWDTQRRRGLAPTARTVQTV